MKPLHGLKSRHMKESKELLTRCFISHSCIAGLLPVVHFNLTLLVFSLSAYPEPGCAGWDLTDPLPLTSSRLAVVKVLPDVPLTQPTSQYSSKASLLAWNLPKGFLSLYPGIRSEFQIRIRVCVWTSCIRYLLKHISPSHFLHQKTFHLVSSSSLLEMSDTSEIAFN